MRWVDGAHRRFEEVHQCDDFCKPIGGSIGRPPTPWCKRFPRLISYQEDNTCWWWTSSMHKTDAQRNRLNFSLKSQFFIDLGYPAAVDACRWIYENEIDDIPEGMQIDHLCENWRCVNPYHLEPVTVLENNQRYRSTRSSWTLRDEHGIIRGRKEVMS
ncbi:HNH endonuclease [Gordonia phage Patos]|uniref:HNH endonuclease n=1 Tax=Gordonia phage Patos TaxID=2927262 RepID=A0A9E7QS38_9CAUD|nr:HNH endonuclease [Gordonia phage Patos]WNN95362.1 HNH endonuclease [Gordonia phage NorManre]